MRIGILTMNYAQNYGGVLQTYALSQYLKGMGYEVNIINYRNSSSNSFYSICAKIGTRLFNKKKQDKNIVPKKSLSPRYLKNFVDFKSEHLNYTTLVNEFTISQCCSGYDAVIVGSDQIWNDVYTNKLVYYFDWFFSGKKISYAACTILDKPPFIRKNEIRKLLSSFDTLTVRDRHTSKYVENLINKDVVQVVDPSCLYDYHDFISENPIGSPYILTYILSDNVKGGNKRAIEIVKQHVGNIPVVSVCIPSVSMISKEISDICMEEASPIEWVNLFYHASFVYTDSFHGIMFSMKFHKSFIAYMKEGGRKSRLQDLIESYNLKNIVFDVQQIEELPFDSLIDYEIVDSKLRENVRFSKQILQRALE